MPLPEEFFVKKEKEWRRDYPAMFSHSELGEGEVHMSTQLVDAVDANCAIYRNAGLTSARVGKTAVKHNINTSADCLPIFVNFRQYVTLKEEHKLVKNLTS